MVAIGLCAILRVVNIADQARMSDGNVIALEIVIDVNFPIAVDDVVAALGELQALELKTTRLLRNFTEISRERHRVWIEINKDKLPPGFQPKRKHAHGAAVQEFDAFHIGSADQAAIERVGPTVVGATENIFAAAAKRDGARAMTANIAEGAKSSLLVANDHDRFPDDFCGKKGLGIGDGALEAVYFPAVLAERADELPGASEDAGFFDIEDRGVGVELRRERLRAFDLFVDVEMQGLCIHNNAMLKKETQPAKT